MGRYHADCECCESNSSSPRRIFIGGERRIRRGIKNVISDKLYYIENELITMGLNRGKEIIGEEILIPQDSVFFEKIMLKFIKKYDKNFNKHIMTTTDSEIRPLMKDKEFIMKVAPQTWCHVTTGRRTKSIINSIDGYSINDTPSGVNLKLFIFGKYRKKVAGWIKKIQLKSIEEDIANLYIYETSIEESRGGGRGNEDDRNSLYIVKNELKPRSMDSLFFSHNEKNIIMKHIDNFLDRGSFYREKELLYKTGIIMYGKPGTGKTSLIRAIANKYHRSIINIDVPHLKTMDLTRLTGIINFSSNDSDIDGFIVVFEDIDTLYLNRDSGDNTNNETIHKLLQFLDSNTSPDNVIFIATTNHIERLDEALLREGRFDLKVEIKGLNMSVATEMGKSFYLSEETAFNIVKQIAKESDKSLTEFNQSLLQAKFISAYENRSFDDIASKYSIMVDTSMKYTTTPDDVSIIEDDDYE